MKTASTESSITSINIFLFSSIVPGQHSDPLPLQIPHQIIPEDLKKSNAPKAMVWTTHHPEGQLVMLETFFFQTNFYVKNRSFILSM